MLSQTVGPDMTFDKPTGNTGEENVGETRRAVGTSRIDCATMEPSCEVEQYDATRGANVSLTHGISALPEGNCSGAALSIDTMEIRSSTVRYLYFLGGHFQYVYLHDTTSFWGRNYNRGVHRFQNFRFNQKQEPNQPPQTQNDLIYFVVKYWENEVTLSEWHTSNTARSAINKWCWVCWVMSYLF
ncbi:hypothetical protein SARC_02538 [Sphaeroforma arctica JP610]|uniref:Uncharacterized protein n=1 Tax=Sphaeroforma arctica JP610 TaxID=667725 RepID=A0A0L0G8N9_9EUKA|nr:hypothetical protein SARC_02538 [Sphaeroforma arctica JP610]KNC85279.1 hypothetical protein SARC_02538 [Sphaeroforma arctica JP610]|eukprot:XP_014159181.1 hypothetical protein SARC_02538 [Sphaeroforma arctica JP610]